MSSPNNAQAQRRDADSRYAQRRKAAREVLASQIAEFTNHSVELDDISDKAIAEAQRLRVAYPEIRQGMWDWGKVVSSFRRRLRHIELAIWVNQALCGLLIGRISDNRIVATIYYLESRPVDNPLSGSVAKIATRYVELLARQLKCKQTAIDSPLPALIDFYRRLGYSSATTKGRKVVRLVKTLSADTYSDSGG